MPLAESVSRTGRTIVQYRDGVVAHDSFPEQIISPSRPGPCCASGMMDIGAPQAESRWIFRYRRCRTCGFTVRRILKEIPDASELAQLRRALARSFVRWDWGQDEEQPVSAVARGMS